MIDWRLEAPVFDMQTMATHDGPGLRTILFLKGCPLRCAWCANPEGQYSRPELRWSVSRCRSCGTCHTVCPENAVSFDTENGEKTPIFDRSKCDRCEEKPCIDKCPNEALRATGRPVTVEEAYTETKKDIRFFWNTNGGITFSGGEPLGNSRWVLALITAYEPLSVGAVIETCGYWEPDEAVREIAEKSQCIYYDIKCMDDETHGIVTGASNHRILENLKWLSEIAAEKIVVSLPIISGVSDSVENATKTADFIEKRGIRRLRILPYHRLGVSKYEELGRAYPHRHHDILIPEDRLDSIRRVYREHRLLLEE